jgi:hypothetical protein
MTDTARRMSAVRPTGKGRERVPCCIDGTRRTPCGTRWAELRVWASATTGKGVKIVALEGGEQGKAPFWAQPVGFDGRAFNVAADYGCDTEKLLHEVCHWLVAPKERRGKENYGLGPGDREVDDVTSDNEEVTVMLLEGKLAPEFRLAASKIAKPDYNVANKRNVDWAECETRAQAIADAVKPSLQKALVKPAVANTQRQRQAAS